eukprot:TRINITY_DN109951_c0_g1_i1.p1 TRINITY_DN109951_c0_g1~~TRINITY_DN109951_c0_g1_i1.p1  ORF type:complete len:675 (-),score=91.00 TRINITY_DN109951_c0_g1_i1:184-2208(-)
MLSAVGAMEDSLTGLVEALLPENCVSIEATSDHGNVLIAKRDYRAGDVIFRETPLILYKGGLMQAYQRCSATLQQELLSLYAGRLPAATDLSDKLKEIDNSAFELAIQGPFDSMAEKAERRQELGRGIFKYLGLASHACRPNARCSSITDDGMQEVFCISDIPSGSEITISYLGENLLTEPTSKRQELLQKRWKFRCRCVNCAVGAKDDVRAFPCQNQSCDGTCYMRNLCEDGGKDAKQNVLLACSECKLCPDSEYSKRCSIREAVFAKYVQPISAKFDEQGVGWALRKDKGREMQVHLDQLYVYFQEWLKPRHYLAKLFILILKDWGLVPSKCLAKDPSITHLEAWRKLSKYYQEVLPGMVITFNIHAGLADKLPEGEERNKLIAKAAKLPELRRYFQRRPSRSSQQYLCSWCMGVLDTPRSGRCALPCSHLVHEKCRRDMAACGVSRCPDCHPDDKCLIVYGLVSAARQLLDLAGPADGIASSDLDTVELDLHSSGKSIPDAQEDCANEIAKAVLRKPPNCMGVHVLEFSRDPAEFHDLLLTSPELKECREALDSHGFQVRLDQMGQAYVFVQPSLYESVLTSLHLHLFNKQLKSRHVIVDSHYKEIVERLVQSLRGKKQVRRKGHQDIPFTFIEKTFIAVKVPSSLRSDPGQGPFTASTSDAHGLLNPRGA